MEFEHAIPICFTCSKCGAPLCVERKKPISFGGRVEEQVSVTPCTNCLFDAKIDGFRQANVTAQRVLDKAFAS